MVNATSDLSGKVVAITGVSAGIGRAAAQSLARRGALVVGVDLRAERAGQIAAELEAEGFAMTARAGDVSDPTECARFVDGVVAERGRIDVLINNVGGAGTPAYMPTDAVTPEQFDDGLNRNLKSAFFCATAAIRHMKTQGGGSIVNVSSVVGNQAMATQVVYAIAKAALDHLTRCLAVEFDGDGIRVNTLMIGGAMTSQSQRMLAEVSAAQRRPTPTAETLPPSVQATPMEEITDALAFLCSDQSRGVTATALAVDQARSAGSVFSAALLDALGGRWTR
jgi:NAD(P)-dependent dehydrogenase (short-subunit alcohol dehydrogenase family)